MNECIESAYMVASHFGARYLESWHLLIAMSNHSYSVAGATLNDYPYEMDRLEEVALELTETDYSQDENLYGIALFPSFGGSLCRSRVCCISGPC